MFSRTNLTLAMVLLIGGCKTAGPDHAPPQSAATQAAQAGWAEPATLGDVDRAWWRSFNDPALTELVERALGGTPDLREAEARIAEARANREAIAGTRLPSVQATGSATENVLSENGQLPITNIPGFSRDFSLFDAGFDASWEIDLWGRRVRQSEAAAAREEALLWARRDLQLALVAEIARTYAELRGAEAALASARAIASAHDDLARLTTLRRHAGEATAMETSRTASDVATARATISDGSARIGAARYRLAALVGIAPEAISPILAATSKGIPSPPDHVLAGVRSDLMERRPDIRRAERDLAALTADVGVATADKFPRFSLFGSLGQQARNPGDLLDIGSTRLSIGPRFSWPIFSGGAIKANIRAADARVQAAAARYDKAVLGALTDSETAINRFLNAQAAFAQAEAGFAAEDDVHRLTRLRFERGEDDRLSLARARIVREAALQRRDAARLAYTQSAIALYKSLGGGWGE